MMISYIFTSASRCKALHVRHRATRSFRLVHRTIRLQTRAGKTLLEMEAMDPVLALLTARVCTPVVLHVRRCSARMTAGRRGMSA